MSETVKVIGQPIARGMAQAVPVIVVNLDRSTDRLAHMRAEFERVRLSFERFPAVNGTDLPENVRSYFCDASGRIISPLRAGEIGVYASFLTIWQRVAAGHYGRAALVCEDDISVPDDLGGLLAAVLRTAPEGWDVIRLSSTTHRAVALVSPLGNGRTLVRYTKSPMLTGATLISRAGAAKLLRDGIRRQPADCDVARPWRYGLDEYGISPAPIAQGRASSVIEEMGGRRHDSRHRTLRRLSQSFSPEKLHRLAHNLRTMGLRQWLACWAVNTALRLGVRPDSFGPMRMARRF